MGVPKEIQMPDSSNYTMCRNYADDVLAKLDEMEREVYKSIKQLTAKRVDVYTKLINVLSSILPKYNYQLHEVASQYLLLPEVTPKQLQYPRLIYSGNTRTYQYCYIKDDTEECVSFELIPAPELTFDVPEFQKLLNTIKEGFPHINVRGYFFLQTTIQEGGDVCNASWCYSMARLKDYSYTVDPSSITIECPKNKDQRCPIVTVLGNDTGVGVYELVESVTKWGGELWYEERKRFGLNIINAVAKLQLKYKRPDNAQLLDEIKVPIYIAIPVRCIETGSGTPSDCYWAPIPDDEYVHNIMFGNLVLKHAMGIAIANVPNARLVPFAFVIGDGGYTYESVVDATAEYSAIKPIGEAIEGLYSREFQRLLQFTPTP